MKVPETPQDVLQNAIEYIDLLGWTRRHYQKGADGPVCALGALVLGGANEGITNYETAHAIVYDGGVRATMMRVATSALAREMPEGITTYNDDHAKDRRSVKAKMRAAIKRLNEISLGNE